jgi:hypothetical protein
MAALEAAGQVSVKWKELALLWAKLSVSALLWVTAKATQKEEGSDLEAASESARPVNPRLGSARLARAERHFETEDRA